MDKLIINPAMIAALEYYSQRRFRTPHTFVYKDSHGHNSPWTIEKTCGMAVDVLANEELAYIKLKTLQDGMKKYGMGILYERIMGEKLE